MKFGINTFLFISLLTNRRNKLFKQFKQSGFESVEITIEDPSHIDPAYPQVRNAVEANPKGIVSSSPGLRACELPWEIVQTTSQPQRGCGPVANDGRNPVGVGASRLEGPRVARSSQPWALLQNPFGIRAFPHPICG